MARINGDYCVTVLRGSLVYQLQLGEMERDYCELYERKLCVPVTISLGQTKREFVSCIRDTCSLTYQLHTHLAGANGRGYCELCQR